jgi:nicotinate-nucleotide adenylyltransferase
MRNSRGAERLTATKAMRIGIFGGTFDPVHYGHLLLAEQCREQLELDAVWFIPAAVNPHKQGIHATPANHRMGMLELALAGYAAFRVSDVELARGGTSYTVDTLQALKSEDPTRELVLLIGADSLADLPTWREPERILTLASVAAVNRGRAPTNLEAILPSLPTAAGRVSLVQMPAVDLSATDIRSRAAAGRSIRYMTPRPVEEYIRQHGLYRP